MCLTLQFAPSPALLDREALKVEKYSRLVMVAKKQHADKKRFSLPTFIPFAVSDIRAPLQTYKNGLWNSIDANVPKTSRDRMDAQPRTSYASFDTSSRLTFNSPLPQVLVQ